MEYPFWWWGDLMRVKLGLDVLLETRFSLIQGLRIGLLTNQSAVTRDLVHIVDALRRRDVVITALFAPEHGVRGDVPAGREVPSGLDPRTKIPTYSLYGPVRKPTSEMLRDVDVIVMDIQDIGCRFYTYIYTMSNVLQACGQFRKPFIVLDRPNPIGGQFVEGNIPEKEFISFVGMHPIPIRHGMTIGELAQYFNSEFHYLADLEVVMCTGWKRSTWYDETGLPWVPTSPNIPTPNTALVYPGFCLLEGTNISEGRGTSNPFEFLGAPWIDGYQLADRLNSLGLPGVRFRTAFFVPTASKFANQQCAGVQVHVTERNEFQPVRTGLHVIKTIRQMYPDMLQFPTAGSTGKPFFDYLAGSDKVRKTLESETPVDELIGLWYSDVRDFLAARRSYLRYI